MESFILTAIEAFKSANGDVEKFELYLRRGMMTTQEINPTVNSTFLDNLEITPDLAESLTSIDLDNMSDAEILEYAKKMGLVQ